jgi:uncharacterized membrane protein YeiB
MWGHMLIFCWMDNTVSYLINCSSSLRWSGSNNNNTSNESKKVTNVKTNGVMLRILLLWYHQQHNTVLWMNGWQLLVLPVGLISHFHKLFVLRGKPSKAADRCCIPVGNTFKLHCSKRPYAGL